MEANDLITHMEVGSEYPGCYYLNCGFERRVTVASQEIRGISLVSALLASGVIKPMPRTVSDGLRVAVVGAGVAGVAAAVRAAYAGCHVALFETGERPLWRFENSARLLHPRLYEWPRSGYEDGNARLPLLSWDAGTGAGVTAELRSQWVFYQRLFDGRTANALKGKVDVTLECGEIQPVSNQIATLRVKDGEESFQAIIFAMGFGEDLAFSWCGGVYRKDHYWDADTVRMRSEIGRITSVENRRPRVLLSGFGDSGLTDLFSAVDVCFRQESIRERFLKPLEAQVEAHAKIVGMFESQATEANAIPPRQFEVNLRQAVKEYTLKNPGSNPFSGIPEVELTLLGRSDPERSHLFSEKSFPLNRLILAFLLESDRVFEIEPPEGWGMPGESDAIPVFYDIILSRHGAERSLEKSFPDVYGAIQSSRISRSSGGIDTGEQFYRQLLAPEDVRQTVFYSDLYDSIIQRQIKTALGTMGLSDWFVPLYRGRLLRDLLLYDKIVLTDSQFLDGSFFRDWSSLVEDSSIHFANISAMVEADWIEFRFRTRPAWHSGDWRDLLWRTIGEIAFGFDGEGRFLDRNFLFSALGEINGVAIGLPKVDPTVDAAIRDAFKEGPSPEVTIWVKEMLMRKFQSEDEEISHCCERLMGYWNSLSKMKLTVCSWDGAFDFSARFGSSFEDPWRFLREVNAVGDVNAEEMLVRVCASLNRSAIQTELDDRKRSPVEREKRLAHAFYEYYNRAYNRTIGRQHGATVVESTYVKEWTMQEGDRPTAHMPSWEQNLSLSSLSFDEFESLRRGVRAMRGIKARSSSIDDYLSARSLLGIDHPVKRFVQELTSGRVSEWEPELALLLVNDSFDIEPLSEYRIYDDISPAARLNAYAARDLNYPSCCSVVEFMSPIAE
ncbi:MAG: FAD-dependent oxidoreductase [Verrucomicrobiales bacterium]|nr:FAD-dependent oxidoreductase [Verrucomicrobiales bacterium]